MLFGLRKEEEEEAEVVEEEAKEVQVVVVEGEEKGTPHLCFFYFWVASSLHPSSGKSFLFDKICKQQMYVYSRLFICSPILSSLISQN